MKKKKWITLKLKSQSRTKTIIIWILFSKFNNMWIKPKTQYRMYDCSLITICKNEYISSMGPNNIIFNLKCIKYFNILYSNIITTFEYKS